MDKIDKTAIERFAVLSGVKLSTILNNWKKIPGITKTPFGYSVTEGTRYPYSMRGKRNLNADKKHFYILDAIFNDKYIDQEMLCCERSDFETYLDDLLAQGLIRKRNCVNQYGANGFLTTPKADAIFRNKRVNQFSEYARILGTFSGSFSGALCKELSAG